MDMRCLSAAVEVMSTGNMGQAAANLDLSPAALSRQIQTLERELGVRLFDRTGRGAQLSDAGRTLADQLVAMLRLHDSVLESAERVRGGRLGTLTIAATPQNIERLVAPFLSRFSRDHPDVPVRVTEAGGAEVFHLVETNEVRIGVSVAGVSDYVDQIPLVDMRLLAIRRRERTDATRPPAPMTLAEVCEHPILALGAQFGSRRTFDLACRTEGLQPSYVFDSSAPDATLAMAAAGQGIAILPSSVDLRATALTGVQVTTADGTALTIPLVAAYNPGLSDPGYVMEAIRGLAAMAASRF